VLRGADVPAYVVMVPRQRWQEIDRQGDTLTDILVNAYGAQRNAMSALMAKVDSIESESWSYEPRLSLFPGQALAP
jgi:hypothetical protein